MSAVSIATVPTQSGSRYLQQLCKHWSHKLTVEFTPEQGTINFPSGVTVQLTAAADHLLVQVNHVDDDAGAAGIAQMRDVVARHLDRFAFREAPLPFDWQAA